MRIKSLGRQILDRVESLESRINQIESEIVEIKSKVEIRSKRGGEPRVATRAKDIGERYKAQLQTKSERYLDENEYLSDFISNLRKFGVTDSEETAAAIHVAMKAFPVLEIADARLMRVWRVMASDHLYNTDIQVEMGWIGLQDWFPSLFSETCFGERLERADLEISIQRMLKLGDMPWVIYLRYCDRSFPESYLPGFLSWISRFNEGGIILFLMRCVGTNRCETNEDFYERIARLPKPDHPEPIQKVDLKDSRVLLSLSDWENWCRPNPDADSFGKKQYEFLIQLKSEIEGKGWQIPMELISEIQHYIQLSYEIMAPTRALDWALTLRFLPWIGNRREIIDISQSLVNEENQELLHFQDGLQTAREEAE